MATTAAPSARKLLVSRRDAAQMLGMSIDSFQRHVEPDCKIVRVGSMRLIPVRELEAWIEARAAQLPEGLR